MAELSNLFANLPQKRAEEFVETLLSVPALRLERIVSWGQSSPEGSWYDQDTDEWVLVLQGAARVRIEGQQPRELTPGGFVQIPAHTRHRVEWTDPAQPTVWLAIHYRASAESES